MTESSGSLSRREALKATAKAAGVAAFAAPVVVGVFNSSASAQTVICSQTNDSDAVTATVIPANYSWNHNSGGQTVEGRYNGQNKNFTLAGGTGTVQVGATGTDNPDVTIAYYVIFPPAGLVSCTPTWQIVGCTGPIATSSAALTATQGPLPYCTTATDPGSPAVQLQLVSITCCPAP